MLFRRLQVDPTAWGNVVERGAFAYQPKSKELPIAFTYITRVTGWNRPLARGGVEGNIHVWIVSAPQPHA